MRMTTMTTNAAIEYMVVLSFEDTKCMTCGRLFDRWLSGTHMQTTTFKPAFRDPVAIVDGYICPDCWRTLNHIHPL